MGENGADSERECRCTTVQNGCQIDLLKGQPPGEGCLRNSLSDPYVIYLYVCTWLELAGGAAPPTHGPCPQVLPLPLMPVPTMYVMLAPGNCSVIRDSVAMQGEQQ